MLGMKAKVKNINYKKGVFLKPYYKYSSTSTLLKKVQQNIQVPF